MTDGWSPAVGGISCPSASLSGKRVCECPIERVVVRAELAPEAVVGSECRACLIKTDSRAVEDFSKEVDDRGVAPVEECIEGRVRPCVQDLAQAIGLPG